MSTYTVLIGFVGVNAHDHRVSGLKMNRVVIDWKAVVGIAVGYMCIEAANSFLQMSVIKCHIDSSRWKTTNH
jgi:hypothetical protein